MKTAVVILNWNGKKLFDQFLPSVIQHSQAAEIILADNASTDDSVDYIRKNYPQIKVIQNQQNLGYAGGYNEALKQVDAEYYILLNSDVEVTPGWIAPVIALMDRDQHIAVCQPKIKSFTERTHFEYAGAAGGFIDKNGFPFCRGRVFNTIEEDKGQYNNTCRIFWASGACMFIRAKVFHQLGGFDADFFAHMEEIDLCWRIQRAGHAVYYTPESTVYHLGGGTLDKSNPRKTYLNFRNNLAMICKNAPHQRLQSILQTRTLLDSIAALKFLLSGDAGAFMAVLKAHRFCNKNKAALMKKRDEIKSTDNASYFPQNNINIITDYYLKGKRTFPELT